MPPDPDSMKNGAEVIFTDHTLLKVVGLFVLGAVARVLVSDEPFKPQRFAGELLLALIGGVTLYSFGLLQGLSPVEMVLMGGLGGLGGVRLLEWAIKVTQSIRAGKL